MSDAIVIDGMTKKYSGRAVVDELTLTVRQGEVFALLGPNGAGKTTTVEILEGYRHPDSGSVQVLGKTPNLKDRNWCDRIGVVLQSEGGMTQLTPREVFNSTAKCYQNPWQTDELIEAVGLTEKANSRIGTLSGGQRRRVDVGLGIIGRPDLLFLDEPTTGFDPQARRQFWDLIRSLAHGGTTIVLTTHYLDEAENLAERVGIIAAGKLLALDTMEGLRAQAGKAMVRWSEDGQAHEENTDTPTAFVRELMGRVPGEIPDLQIRRPTLEDTYLELIAPHVNSSEETS